MKTVTVTLKITGNESVFTATAGEDMRDDLIHAIAHAESVETVAIDEPVGDITLDALVAWNRARAEAQREELKHIDPNGTAAKMREARLRIYEANADAIARLISAHA